ncbi:peptidyl-prolyl cis-trans isomerase [Geomobilimonas luticola]|uniref:Periplasmic chaperone PpiD n=1 Tax=Geomobilimonas luticola TaxID=1114878 RepID=A0ABS5SGT6_9BACT|nr:peptidyl-prolyl cis-trans isomerase [Geomobilimonas luticola]MBT0654580.1 peptidyl-prolyl cis-trans isomerase [Geomobilimonas luticola]
MKRIIGIAAMVVGTSSVGALPAFAAVEANPPAAVAGEAKPGVAAVQPAGETEAADEVSLDLRVPLFSKQFSRTPVAVVNDDPILLEELTTALASVHERPMPGKSTGKKNFTAVLNRLINVRLIVQEATNMGLDETPEVKKPVDDYAETTLKEHLKLAHARDAKPDEKVIEQLYRQEVKEWKIKSVKFEKEEDAKALAEELAKGGNFDELAAKLVESGKAEGSKEGAFMKPAGLLPQIVAAVSAMEVGKTSPVIQVGPSFTILKLEEIGYPDNAEAREKARQQATEIRRAAMVREYFQAMKKRYATIDKKLLDKLNFEAPKPGFKKLLTDKRVVARVKGEKPITVGDLADAVAVKFYHGIDQAIREKKVNDRIHSTLDEMLYNRVFRTEALKEGIDKTDAYRNSVKEYKSTILFGRFVEKVIVPEVKITEGEVADYYTEHKDEFSSPAMIKLKSLAFSKKEYAEAALEKLRKGTDFAWLKANAEGQATRSTSTFLEFDGSTLVTKNLPAAVLETVTGAKAGDFRLHGDPEGFFYVLAVVDLLPAKPSPLEEERKTIVKKVFGEKMNKAVEEWGNKLKKAYSVQVYVADHTH